MNRKLLILFFLLCFVITGYSQVTITGRVTDAADGTSLPGVTIRVKDTSQGTVTDMDGQFELTAAEDAVLIFSFIGMADTEVEVQGRTVINVSLGRDVTNLQEVVFIGYGTGTRQDLTAPVTTIRSEEINRQITANPAQALQGKVAGMQVTNSGEPGSLPQIRIRGVSTAYGAGGGPLYVVDGIIVSNISFLNNNDIESITILKDASAGAIYGVQAANGVILITTKEGKKGATQIDFSSYTGFQNATNVLEMANSRQYIELLNQRAGLTGLGNTHNPEDFPTSTNWYEELTRPAMITSHELSVSGGTDNSSYSFGVGYFYQDGILNSGRPDNNNNFNRLNFRVKNDYFFNRVDLGYNLIFSKNNNTPANNYSLFQAYVSPPAYQARDNEGNWSDPTALGFSGPFANPAATVYYFNRFNDDYTVIPSAYLAFDPLKNFHFRSSFSADLAFGQSRGYTPEFYVSGLQQNPTSNLNRQTNFRRNLQFDNTLEYKNLIGNHDVKLMLGSSVQELFNNYLSGTAYNIPDIANYTQYLAVGDDTGRNADDGGFKSRVLSFFTRLSYNYDTRYLLTATLRADGSSRYNDHWGLFPSVGLGWVISQEEFLSNQDLFSYLKIRGSWGQLGNNNIPASSSVIVGGPGPGTTGIFGGNNPIPGLTFQTVYNNFIVWETIEEFNIGFELFSLAERLNMEVDFYTRTTNNAVFNAPVAGVSGTDNMLDNNGKIRNRGIDFNMGWTDRSSSGEFTYSFNGNFSTVANEVLSLKNERGRIFGALSGGEYLTLSMPGMPIGSFYGYRVIGVFQSLGEINDYKSSNGVILQPDAIPGDFKYENVTDDDVINDEDRVNIGSPIPNFIYGFTANVGYLRWDASVVLQGVLGNKVYNAKRTIRNVFPDANYDLDFYENYWQGSGTSNTYPSSAVNRRNIRPNTFFVEPGDYFRVRSVQLGYTIDGGGAGNLFFKSLRLYLSAQNPVTLFGYNGYTPEIGGSPIATGIDNDTYPLSATYTAGINVVF